MTNTKLLAKIKAEIERRKGICTAQIKANPGQTFPFVMEMTGYDKILSFLSTLEEPVCEELEKAAGKRLRGVCNLAEGTKEDRPLEERLQELKEIREKKDLDEAADKYAIDYPAYNDSQDIAKYAFIAGAKWQKERFEKNRLAACDKMTEEECKREMNFADEIINKEHRTPTFSDAINYGMQLQREQMMKETVGVQVVGEQRDLRLIDSTQRCLFDAKRGDWLKVIIVKED